MRKSEDEFMNYLDIRAGRMRVVPGQHCNKTWLLSQIPEVSQQVAEPMIDEYMKLTKDGYVNFDDPRVRELTRKLKKLMP
jgi:hypothetical protein